MFLLLMTVVSLMLMVLILVERVDIVADFYVEDVVAVLNVVDVVGVVDVVACVDVVVGVYVVHCVGVVGVDVVDVWFTCLF